MNGKIRTIKVKVEIKINVSLCWLKLASGVRQPDKIP